jgi:hypothetical protein
MADPSVVIVRNLPAEPETRQVYARMGFKPHKADIPEAMKPLVIEAMALGRDLVKPIACFCNHRIIMPSGTETRRHDERLEIESAFAIDSRKVITWMNGCSEIYLAAVTLGPELDAKVAELSQSGDMTRAFLLNAYGGEAAEALMESLDREIARQVQARGMTTTKRYSPGYGDWLAGAPGRRTHRHPLDGKLPDDSREVGLGDYRGEAWTNNDVGLKRLMTVIPPIIPPF